jgi:phosphoglycerate dehydrogenase-like enzyme
MSELFTPDQLEARIGEADFVLVTVPESPDTVGMFNASLFAKMKRGSYFISISRGRICVTADLIDALRSGQLAGAGLDVVDPEPLPSDSPLWAMPNVLITPHIAISGAPYHEKWREILLENCRRFAAGEPLMNVVDKEKWF